MESLVGNHPFVDGNKRAGLVVTGLFLARNGYVLTADNTQVLAFTMQVASGELDHETIAHWLQSHSQEID
jgi:death-on-curing protein